MLYEKINYDKLPSRGKITSCGVETRKHVCAGRCYVFYDEARIYRVECEKCGLVATFETTSLGNAILTWNDMLSHKAVVGDGITDDTEAIQMRY